MVELNEEELAAAKLRQADLEVGSSVAEKGKAIEKESQQKPKQSLGNTLQDIGGIGRNIGRSFQGKAPVKTRIQQLQEQTVKQEELTIRRSNFRHDTVKNVTPELTQLVSSGATQEQLEQFYAKFPDNQLTSGVADDLRFKAELLQTQGEQELATFSSLMDANGLTLSVMGVSSLREAKALLDQSPALLKVFKDKADARHLSTGIQKVGDVKTLIAQGLFPDQDINLATFIDVINPQLTKDNADKKLTTNEVQALLRNPDQLERLGVTIEQPENLIKTDLGDRIIFTKPGKPDVIVKEFKKGLTPSSDTLGKPPTVDQLLKLEGPNGEVPPLGVSLNELKEQGFTVIPKITKQQEDKLKAVKATLDKLTKLADPVFTSKPGVFSRIFDDVFKAIGRFTQNDVDIVLFESFSQGTIASLVRAAGERGNLSNKDIDRGINLIPKAGDGFFELPDTREVALRKLQGLREWFADIAGVPIGNGSTGDLTAEEQAELDAMRGSQ